jgi:hypothetical protein
MRPQVQTLVPPKIKKKKKKEFYFQRPLLLKPPSMKQSFGLVGYNYEMTRTEAAHHPSSQNDLVLHC